MDALPVVEETDLSFASRPKRLVLSRFYNSKDNTTGPLGRGWTHTYDVHVREHSDGTVAIERRDGLWRLDSGRLADPDMVQRALEGLRAIDTSEVISTSEQKRAEFGVDADGGTTVVVRARGKKVAGLVVGEAADVNQIGLMMAGSVRQAGQVEAGS